MFCRYFTHTDVGVATEYNEQGECLLIVTIFLFPQVVDKCLLDGADEYLQLMALCSTVMQQLCHGD